MKKSVLFVKTVKLKIVLLDYVGVSMEKRRMNLQTNVQHAICTKDSAYKFVLSILRQTKKN